MKLSVKSTLAIALTTVFLIGSIGLVAAQTTNLSGVTSPTSTNLNAVCIVNNATGTNGSSDLTKLNAWAVGDSGTIAMWNGNSWTTVSSPTSANLYSVAFVNATSGWAVGGSGNVGTILRYNGTWSEWKVVSFSSSANGHDVINSTLYAVTLTHDGSSGWIVGANGITLGWGAGTWYGMTQVTQNTLRAVSVVDNAVDAWAVGDGGTIIHWNGQTWSPMTSNTNAPLYAIQIFNDKTGWAAGGSGSQGTVLQVNSTGWSQYNNFKFGTGNSTSNLNSVINSLSFTNETAGWAVGSNGMVMYWSGNVWECNQQITNVNLKGVSIIHNDGGSTQAWTVGEGGKILAFNGTNWVPEFPIVAIPVLLGIGFLAVLLGKLRPFKKWIPVK